MISIGLHGNLHGRTHRAPRTLTWIDTFRYSSIFVDFGEYRCMLLWMDSHAYLWSSVYIQLYQRTSLDTHWYKHGYTWTISIGGRRKAGVQLQFVSTIGEMLTTETPNPSASFWASRQAPRARKYKTNCCIRFPPPHKMMARTICHPRHLLCAEFVLPTLRYCQLPADYFSFHFFLIYVDQQAIASNNFSITSTTWHLMIKQQLAEQHFSI